MPMKGPKKHNPAAAQSNVGNQGSAWADEMGFSSGGETSNSSEGEAADKEEESGVFVRAAPPSAHDQLRHLCCSRSLRVRVFLLYPPVSCEFAAVWSARALPSYPSALRHTVRLA